GAVVWTLVRRKPRRAAAAVLLGAAAAAAVFFLNIQSPSDYYGDGADAVDPVGTVTLSIRCDVLTGVAEEEHVPGDGVILPETEIEFSRGETVYDALIRAARKNGIQIDKKSSGGGLVYVCAIGYLYELTYGDLSGWIYRVNGETPYVGCAEYVLSDGDRIQWDYTLNLGLDVGGS
ncbi:MAG: DUF4430 domain-containing protein, partial [Oscillospiraceae bacterium]|nr:DUF4430 domain-containing protein [Oscillospiraceae bacterium]